MSKFFKALEQAERDRLGRETEPISLEQPESVPESLEPASDERAPLQRAEPGPAREARRPEVEPTSPMDGHLVSLLAPATAHAEQYRSLRNAIEAKATPGRGYVVAVSSPGKGDGKTTTAINLAGALTQSESTRVLLVEADLRAPALAGKIGVRVKAGLIDAIREGSLDLDELALACQRPNLRIVAAGRATSTPYEILQSPRFGALIEQARQSYDFVVLDTPPMVPMPDCRLIGRYADGVVVVIAAHRTPRKMVEESLRDLPADKFLGFVFNRADEVFPGGYYSYYYGEPSTNGHGPAFSWIRRWLGSRPSIPH